MVLAFEDLHPADSGCSFIDYLCVWSDRYPLFIGGAAPGPCSSSAPARQGQRGDPPQPLSDHAIRKLCLNRSRPLGGPARTDPAAGQRRPAVRSEDRPCCSTADCSPTTAPGTRSQVTSRSSTCRRHSTAIAAARLDELSPRERAITPERSVHGHSFTAAGSPRSSDSTTRRSDASSTTAGSPRRSSPRRERSARTSSAIIDRFLQGCSPGFDRRRQILSAPGIARAAWRARTSKNAWGDAAGEVADRFAADLLDAANAEPKALDAARSEHGLRDARRGRATSPIAGARPKAVNAFDRAAELTTTDHLRAELLEQSGRCPPARPRLHRRHRASRNAPGSCSNRPTTGPRVPGLSGRAGPGVVPRRPSSISRSISDKAAARRSAGGGAEQAAAFRTGQGPGYSGQLGEAVVAADAALRPSSSRASRMAGTSSRPPPRPSPRRHSKDALKSHSPFASARSPWRSNTTAEQASGRT